MTLQHDEPLQSAYRGVKATVVGASGFIGRWVARELCRQGAHVSLVLRDANRSESLFEEYGIRGEIHEIDLLDNAAGIRKCLEGISPAIVFNLAGYGVDRGERDESIAYRINRDLVNSLAAVMAGMISEHWQGQQLVHAGSALEYGAVGGNLAEDSTVHATTLYGKSKLAGTQTLSDFCSTGKLRAVTARLFTVYGPGEHRGRLLPSLMEAAEQGHKIQLTDGRQQRDFTYVEEVAEGLLRLGAATTIAGPIVNLASGRLLPVREFVETAAEILSIPEDYLEFDSIETRPEEMEHGPVSNRLLEETVNWLPECSVYNGVSRTLEFLRAGAPT